MLPLLASGDPFRHTWNTWLIEFYGHDLDLRTIPICRDLGISNAVASMIFVALVLMAIGISAGSEAKRAMAENRSPRGFARLVEYGVQFVRDDMMKQNLPHHYRSPYFISLFCTLFFFILFCNLIGLLPQPFGHTPTGSPFVNFGMAFGITYLVGMWGGGFHSHGVGFLAHIAPHAPFPVRWFILWPIEFLGLLVKPVALTIRLTANMTAGHIILAVLVGFLTLQMGVGVSILVKGASALGYAAITAFEVAIALIQAYIFTVLSTVFVGASLSHEH